MRMRSLLGFAVLGLTSALSPALAAPAPANAATISLQPSASTIHAVPFTSRSGAPKPGAGKAKVTITARTGGPPKTFGVNVLGYVCWNGKLFGTEPQDKVPKPACFGQMVGEYVQAPTESQDEPLRYTERYVAGRYKAQGEVLRTYENSKEELISEDPAWSQVTSFTVVDQCDWKVTRRSNAVSSQTPGEPGDPWPCDGQVQFFGPGPEVLGLRSGYDGSRLEIEGPATTQVSPVPAPRKQLGLAIQLEGQGAADLREGKRFGAAPTIITTPAASVSMKAAKSGGRHRSRSQRPASVKVSVDKHGTTTVKVRSGRAIVVSTNLSGKPHGHDLRALCIWGKSRSAIVTAGHFTRVRPGKPPAGALRQARRKCRALP